MCASERVRARTYVMHGSFAPFDLVVVVLLLAGGRGRAGWRLEARGTTNYRVRCEGSEHACVRAREWVVGCG